MRLMGLTALFDRAQHDSCSDRVWSPWAEGQRPNDDQPIGRDLEPRDAMRTQPVLLPNLSDRAVAESLRFRQRATTPDRAGARVRAC